MKFISLSALLFICLVNLEVASGQLEVVVKQEDYNRQALERVCCLITQSRCTTNCAGQSCTATCAGRCGFLGLITCGPYTCSGIASSTCTASTG